MDPPISREPRPRSVTGRSRCDGSVRSDSFARRLWCQSPWSCQVSTLCPAASSRCCAQAREREVHVVAAEQDVLPDGDALEREIAVALRDGDQAEVRSPATDVADEDQVSDGDAAAPASPRPSIHA